VFLAVLAASWATAANAAVTTLDFDGRLPPGAEFARSSPAVGARGRVVAADLPRFQAGAVSAGASFVRALPSSDRVLASTEIAGIQYSLVRLGSVPALTTGEPGESPPPVYAFPDPSLVDNFDDPVPAWGVPCAAEILPDESVIVHTAGGGSERRSMTLRTTLASFSDPDGFELVRVSDYSPPPGAPTTVVDAVYPRRSLFLPNLGVWASAVSEYQASGLVSSVYPGAGRDLGYASTDSGRTWQRVIDSDLDVPDRILQPIPKHMHHLEPFEWFDESTSTWKIAVVAVIGDASPTPQQGQIVARARGATLPDLPAETYDSVARLKVIGVNQLTDVFPLSSSGTASGGPVFLGGTDGTQAGVASMTLQGDVQTDAVAFRPTVTLARKPYVLQMGRLGTGAIVAPAAVFGELYYAEGIWISDPEGLHWTTAYLPRHTGFRGIIPVGRERFWTFSGREDRAYDESSLWELPGPPSVRSSILLEPPASDVPVQPAFAAGGSVSTTVVTDVPPPIRVGANHEVLRVRSESLSKGQRFDALAAQTLSAAPGQIVQLSFWVKPARSDLGVADFQTALQLTSPGGGSTFSESVRVKLDLNDWTPIVVTRRVPAEGTSRATARFTIDENASASLPLEYYFTEPQLVVSDQPTIATYRRGETTAGDRLTVHLPELQDEWSVAVWATEAPNLVLSLLGPEESHATVEQTAVPSERTSLGLRSAFAFSFGSPTSGTVPVGEVAERDVVVPTQDLVVITRAHGRLTLYAARGMGPLETLEAGSDFDFAPTELRFGTPSWDRVFEGTVHRVKVWDDAALDLAGVEAERVSVPRVPAPASCGMLGIEGLLGLLLVSASRRRLRRATGESSAGGRFERSTTLGPGAEAWPRAESVRTPSR
jgi:hypothetical protein